MEYIIARITLLEQNLKDAEDAHLLLVSTGTSLQINDMEHHIDGIKEDLEDALNDQYRIEQGIKIRQEHKERTKMAKGRTSHELRLTEHVYTEKSKTLSEIHIETSQLPMGRP